MSLILLLCNFPQAKEDYFSYPTQKFNLANGLCFINRTVPHSKISCIEVLIKAGSARESKFLGSGVSHFTEHMVFKSNKKYKPGQIHKLARSWGGFINGYTSMDYTHYKIVVLNEYLPKAIELMKNMLLEADFKKNLLKKEREVILNEIKLKKDNPEYIASRLLFKTVYKNHPYSLPVLGYENNVTQITLKELTQFYRNNYVPSNMIMSIVSPKTHEKNLSIVNKIYGIEDVYSNEVSNENVKVESQITPRGKIKLYPTKLVYLNLAFPSIDIKHKDLYALDVLASILGSGGSSKLNKELNIKRGLVNWIGAYNYTPMDKGIFNINASTDVERLKPVIQNIFEEIKKVKQGNITSDEIEKAINSVKSSQVFELETVQAQATSLVINEFFTGNYDFTKRYIKKIEKLTKQDIVKVAEKYLDFEKINLTMVLPEDKKSEFIQELLNEDYLKNYSDKELEIDINLDSIETLLIKKEKKVPLKIDAEFRKFTLSNGITLLIKKDSTLPIVSVRCVFKGGVRTEKPDNNGISRLTASMLLGGTTNLSKVEILKKIEKLGGSIGTDSGYNSFSVGMSILSKYLDTGLDVFLDVMKNSNFPDEIIAIEKQKQIQMVRHIQDSIFKVGLKKLRLTLFKQHPYRFITVGRIKSIQNIKRNDIVNFYNRYVNPENMVFTITGDINIDKVYENINSNLGNWGTDVIYEPEIVLEQIKLKEIKEKVVHLDKYQHLLMYGFRGIKITDEDRYSLDVFTRIISGGGSRLWQAIREKEGLAYTLGAYFVPGIDPGYFAIYILTKSKDLNKIENLIKKQIRIIKQGKITDNEIKLAKRELIGAYLSGLQSNSSLAYTVSLDEIYGLGFNNFKRYERKIKEVTKKDIIRVAKKYITMDKFVLIKVLPKEQE